MIDILALSLQGFIDAGAQSALSGISDGGGKCEITPEHHIRCTKPIKAPSVGFNAALRVNSLLPLVDGMSLAGSLGMMNLSTAVLDIGARPLRLAPPAIDCGTAGASTIAAFGANPRAWEIVQGAIAITNQGTAPLFLCDYQIVGNDWANAFPRTGVRPDGGVAPIDIPVRFAAPDVRYYQGGGPGRPANYPCLVLIKTTAGTRAVSLGPAPLITQEKLDQLETELLVEVGNCQLLVDNWWDGNHGLGQVSLRRECVVVLPVNTARGRGDVHEGRGACGDARGGRRQKDGGQHRRRLAPTPECHRGTVYRPSAPEYRERSPAIRCACRR